MNNELFNKFCLEGKITEKHAEEIKELISSHIDTLLGEIEEKIEGSRKSSYRHNVGRVETPEDIVWNSCIDDILSILQDYKIKK